MTAFTITFILTPSPAHKFHILELTAGWGEVREKKRLLSYMKHGSTLAIEGEEEWRSSTLVRAGQGLTIIP